MAYLCWMLCQLDSLSPLGWRGGPDGFTPVFGTVALAMNLDTSVLIMQHLCPTGYSRLLYMAAGSQEGKDRSHKASLALCSRTQTKSVLPYSLGLSSSQGQLQIQRGCERSVSCREQQQYYFIKGCEHEEVLFIVGCYCEDTPQPRKGSLGLEGVHIYIFSFIRYC